MSSIRVEIFKTSVLSEPQADKILFILNKKFPAYKINFDLNDCDNILRVEGENIFVNQVISTLNFYEYECELLC